MKTASDEEISERIARLEHLEELRTLRQLPIRGFLDKLPRLESLFMEDGIDFSSLHTLKSLKHLRCPISDAVAEYFPCPSVTTVEITRAWSVGRNVGCFFMLVPNIKAFRVAHGVPVKASLVSAVKGLKKLETLQLFVKEKTLREGLVKRLAPTMSHLTKLTLGANGGISLAPCRKLTQLRELNLLTGAAENVQDFAPPSLVVFRAPTW